MQQRLSKLEAAQRLGVSPSTLDFDRIGWVPSVNYGVAIGANGAKVVNRVDLVPLSDS